MNRKRFSPLLCCIIGGVAGLCLLLPAIGVLIFVVPVPALAVVQRQRERKDVIRHCAAFVLGLCMVGYAPAFTIRPTIPEGLVFWVDLAVYTALCVLHGVVLTAALWLGHRIVFSERLRPLSIALFWGGAEWLLGVGPFAWPTLRLSMSLWQYPVLIRTASLGGQLLVNVIIMAVASLLAMTISAEKRNRTFPILLAVLLFAANLSYGLFYPPAPACDTSVVVVQPGGVVIGENRGVVYNTSLKLAEQAAENTPALILLPESILPGSFEGNHTLEFQWKQVALQSGADLLVGGIQNGTAAAYHFSNKGEIAGTYQKTREVPFFENGGDSAPFRWLPREYEGVMDTCSGPLGVMICYESMFSTTAAQAAREGAALLTVLTNDSWFDCTAAKDLHFAHGTFRAVETGRTLVQAGLNGHTAVVDRTGCVTRHLASQEQALLQAQVSLNSADTLYLQMGDWWLLLSIAAVILAVCYKETSLKKGRNYQ